MEIKTDLIDINNLEIIKLVKTNAKLSEQKSLRIYCFTVCLR
jgi:hypothetical protein